MNFLENKHCQEVHSPQPLLPKKKNSKISLSTTTHSSNFTDKSNKSNQLYIVLITLELI